ncbi:MAG: pyridoxamine kinase [Lachnospiraceae bacterium]|nr:pyridoxamine kinase [Lachnospiraceae bacterium]
MKVKTPKKIAVINSFAGFGRCSITVALPVISAMRVQACPVPTSILSNHLAFPHCHFDDYTDRMPDYLDTWQQLDLSFDGILCGFLGSVRQIQIVEDFIGKQSASHPVVIIDPVMGDHGKAYRTITPEHCEAMKNLVKSADIITPNITEACLLTDTPYHESSWNKDSLEALSAALHAMGPSHVVITGIMEPGHFINYVSYDDIACTCSTPIAGESRPGTGDIFASIIAADAVNKTAFLTSVKKAADFIRTCTKASSQADIPVREGVCFENFLHLLVL